MFEFHLLALPKFAQARWHYVRFHLGNATTENYVRVESDSELLVGGLFEREKERERQLKKRVLTVNVRTHLTASRN